MGPSEQKPPVLIVNGVDYGHLTGIPEVSLDGEAEIGQKAMSLDGGSLSFSCKLKHFRCGSRKRFVKLLMSKGTPKRKAELIADGVCLVYESYQTAWNCAFWTGSVLYAVLPPTIANNQR